MKKLNVQSFIENHADWEKLLSAKPYCLKITRETWNGLRLVMLRYSQFDSDFNEPVCRECRGLVLNEDTLEPVSFPFFKFGNISEGPWVDRINWSDHPYVLEKCDGSLVKISKIGGKLLISTSGNILASSAEINRQLGCGLRTYEELFFWALKEQFPDFDREKFAGFFDEGFTYMFELCTKWNRIVVPHEKPKTYFIGVRNNRTFEETFVLDHPLSKIFPTPRLYDFGTFDECLATARALPWDAEGYVVTGRDFRRVKVKSLMYLAVHHFLGESGTVSPRRALDIIRRNETAEVLSYFPDYAGYFDEISEKIDAVAEKLEASWREFAKARESERLETRKEQAGWIVSNCEFPGILFLLLDGKIKSVREGLDRLPNRSLLRLIGFDYGEQ